MADNKDTIYVDVDDEITTLIDKVKASSAKVVALVLPKRATVLQSVVNMKLLKRTAENEKKNLVLITTEAGLLPLAGAVGLYVATTLASKPVIPAGPNISGASDIISVDEEMNLPLDDDIDSPDLTKKALAGATVGALADAGPRSINGLAANDAIETLELEDEKLAPLGAAASMDATAKTSKIKKDKSLKVPNFDRFRLLLVIGVIAIILLIILAILALDVWPHATIDIKTNASNVNASLNLTLDPSAQSADLTSGDIPAKQVSEQKTFTQTVNTTGQKNEGTAATGSVNMTALDCPPYNYNDQSFTVPAGTGISQNNLTYITQNDTVLSPSGFDNKQNLCIKYVSSSATNISAQSPGTSYNAGSGTTFTVASYPAVTAVGSASGGTDSIVQTVAQSDITTATSKIDANGSGTAKQDLINELKGQGLYPVDVTFTAGSPQISSNPNVGSTSSTVTVTETITYSMFGAKQSDLNAALNAAIFSQTAKGQNIITNGLNETGFHQVNTSGTTDAVSLSVLAEVGPNIYAAQVKKEVAGKTPQQVIAQLKLNPDVTNVTVRLNPFYVTKIPTNQAKINVTVAKPTKAG